MEEVATLPLLLRSITAKCQLLLTAVTTGVAACAKAGESRQFENRVPNDPDKSSRNRRRESPQSPKEADNGG